MTGKDDDRAATSVPLHLLERLRHHALDKANTAFSRSTMREASQYWEAGVGRVRPSDDALWDQTLAERDEYHEVADRLASAIAGYLLVEIGEHSSGNCPWMRALEAIENAPPQPRGPVAQGTTPLIVPSEPLQVFAAGIWTWTHDGTGQAFSHTDLDAAAFVTYRGALAAQKQGGGNDQNI